MYCRLSALNYAATGKEGRASSILQKFMFTMLCMVLVASTVMNFVMIRRNRSLTEHIKSYTAQLSPPIGVPMPDLEGRDSSQALVSLNVRDTNRPTIVFVFSPTRHFCKDNWTNWDRLLENRTNGAWRAVFLNVGTRSTEDFRKTHVLGDYLIEDVTKKTIDDYRVFYTPGTLVIGSDGKIRRSWTGVLNKQDMADLLQEATAIN